MDEVGYVIVPKDGGEPVGPFWTWYNLGGIGDHQVARQRADATLNELIETAAAEMITPYGQ